MGEYPGLVSSACSCRAKCDSAPTALQYAFQLDSGRYVDPTDAAGQVPADELCTFGWLKADGALCRVNEPTAFSAGGRANVAAVEQQPGADSLLIGVVTDIPAGAELLIRYGDNYDRSRWTVAAS